MSAKACNRCGWPIVFGKEQGTDKILPLSVGARAYRVVKDNIVVLDEKVLIHHVCKTGDTPLPPPIPDRNFSEPEGDQ